MTEKEFRKLRSLDLIQILLTQGNEEVRLQEELDRQKAYLAELRGRNDSLKTELNDKDALIETLKQDLNKSDAEIHDLREELKALYTDKRIGLENIGSLTEAAQRVNQIFETAQRQAEEYLAHPERIPAEPLDISYDEVATNHRLTIIDSADTDDIKVEVAKKEFAAETAETPGTVIFETSDNPMETASDESSENADEVISENTTADVTDNPSEIMVDDITMHPSETNADDITTHPSETIADDITTHLSETIVDDNVTTHSSETIVDDNVTTHPSETIVDDDVTTHLSETIVGDDVTTHPLETVVDDDVTTHSSEAIVDDDITTHPSEAIDDDVTTHPSETIADDITTHSSEAIIVDTSDHTAEYNPNNIEEVVTIIAEESVEKIEHDGSIAGVRQEPQHHKTAPKKTHSNKNWFRRFIGGAKKEKSGR